MDVRAGLGALGFQQGNPLIFLINQAKQFF